MLQKISKKAVILQPSYLPWLGFFDLVSQADVFVLLDDVQFTVRDWRTRNRIRTDKGWAWLSVPVSLEKSYREYFIKDVRISYDHDWRLRHLNALRQHYKRSGFFGEIYPILEKCILRKYKFLFELDTSIIFEICGYLGLSLSKFKFSSGMRVPADVKGDRRLLCILGALDAEIGCYLSGDSGRNYMDPSIFKEKGIEVSWHDYRHPFYRQDLWGTDCFISHLSVIDLLFNHGREGLGILTGNIKIPVPEGTCFKKAEDIKGGKL